MILFRPDMAAAICAGTKTVTRRRGKARWVVGVERLCFTRPPFVRPPGRPFARVRILSVTREVYPGGMATMARHPLARALARQQVAQEEGFPHWRAFRNAYIAINDECAFAEPCWRVEFQLVEALDGESHG